MAIHYRVYETWGILSPTIFRSLERAKKRGARGENIYAFPSRQAAVDLSPVHLSFLNGHEEPELLTAERLQAFAAWHERAKDRYYWDSRGRYSAYQRQQIQRENSERLFGFTPDGQAIQAEQRMSVSANYVRYSCPIYVNGKKSTITRLKNAAAVEARL